MKRIAVVFVSLLVAFGLILKDGKVVIIPDAVCFRIMTEEGKSYHVFLDDQLTPLAAIPTEEIKMGGVVNERKLAGGGKGK
jgi:hypothetical protein